MFMKKLEDFLKANRNEEINQILMRSLTGGIVNGGTGGCTSVTQGGVKPSPACSTSGCVTYESDKDSYRDDSSYIGTEYFGLSDCY